MHASLQKESNRYPLPHFIYHQTFPEFLLHTLCWLVYLNKKVPVTGAFRGGPAAPPTPPSRPGRQPADAHLELVLVGTRLLCGGRPRGAQALLQVTHGDELAGCEGTTAGVWNTGGYFSRPPSSASHPGARWPAGPWGGPSGGPCPRTVWTPSPGACSARQPEALTGLSDGDGEAVAVGAALGLDGHVAGGVTCRRGRARQARGAEPLPARPTPQLRQGSQGRLLSEEE